MHQETKSDRLMSLVTVFLSLGLFALFIAGLASKSVSPVFLGKSSDVWVITLTAGLVRS